MNKAPFKQTRLLFLGVIAFSLILAQPLWAAAEETPADKQEESFFQGLKRNLDGWLGKDNSADKAKAKAEAAKQAEQKSQDPAAKQSGGRKAINSFKKGMNQISDNVSESVERDKKTLKKKIDKYSSKK